MFNGINCESMYLQLSISMWHSCRSIGKYCKFIGHDAVMVNLWIHSFVCENTSSASNNSEACMKREQKNEKKKKNNITLFTGRISESTKYDEIKINYVRINYDVMNNNLLAFFLHFPHFISVKSARTLYTCVCVCMCVCRVRVVCWCFQNKVQFISICSHKRKLSKVTVADACVWATVESIISTQMADPSPHCVCGNIINAPVYVCVCVCARWARSVCALDWAVQCGVICTLLLTTMWCSHHERSIKCPDAFHI